MIWSLNPHYTNLLATRVNDVCMFVYLESSRLHIDFYKFWNYINLLSIKIMVVLGEWSQTICSKEYVSWTHPWICFTRNFYIFNIIKFSWRTSKFWCIFGCGCSCCSGNILLNSFTSTTTFSIPFSSSFSININSSICLLLPLSTSWICSMIININGSHPVIWCWI